MPKRLTTEQFVAKAREIHGDKYDYSKVVYVNAKTKVCVTCKEHGDFWITPDDLTHGTGCKLCYHLVCGVGISDLPHVHDTDAYIHWMGMIRRCYNKKYLKTRPTYSDCTVCKEWLRFSIFKKWFDKNYIQGYALDKDILVKGNRVYSPETCCFVPNEINTLLVTRKSQRGNLPLGVTPVPHSVTYRAHLGNKHLGCFSTPEEAFQAYKSAKEQYVKERTLSYFERGLITEKVKDALLKYEVNITD